ncbi:MAG: potassium/proton antiporter, partial [Endomicrobiales bacterium]
MISIETILIIFSALLIISIVISKASSRFGIPALLLFLIIGMMAGSEGIGGIYFDNTALAQYIGVVALVFILFSGGLETEWKAVRPVIREGLALATLGVLITALLLGGFVIFVLKFSLVEGLLLGAIVSSTDAAAVFAVLRSKKVSLKGELRPLLELESGSNDPMAVFLTIGFISLLVTPGRPLLSMAPLFLLQMGLGTLLGYATGKGIVFLINKIKLEYDGLYPVLTLSAILFAYAVITRLGGSGFLAVYIAGLIVGNSNLVQKRYLIHFHEGLAWLMQIAMFLTMGLLVFPSRLAAIAVVGLMTSLFLMLVARPLGVFATLVFSRFNLREKTLISWVGLRGSVPIILATFPLLAGVERSEAIFNIVFFIVLTSVLLQGTTIPFVARLLGVRAPLRDKKKYPLEFEQTDALNTRLIDFTVPYNSWMAGKAVSEVGLPPDSLITLIARNEDFVIPS